VLCKFSVEGCRLIIYVYHDNGQLHSLPELLPTGGSNSALLELLSFCFTGNNYNNLYVLNGYKKYNLVRLYQLNESNAAYAFMKVFTSDPAINSIFHPYDLTFYSNDHIFVSSQDRNVVTGLNSNGIPLSVKSFLMQSQTV
jgi:hypothetical protein